MTEVLERTMLSLKNETRLREQLFAHEGNEKFPYTDTTGRVTIGVGRNLTDVGLSPAEIAVMFNNDLDVAFWTTRRLMAEYGIRDLNGPRLAVLVNMAFNMGYGGLTSFKKMWAALQHLDYDKATVEMLDSKWADQVGKRAIDLAAQMSSGRWA